MASTRKQRAPKTTPASRKTRPVQLDVARKPPSSGDEALRESFVSTGKASKRSDVQTSDSRTTSLVERKNPDGTTRILKRATVYFSPELAKRLKHAATDAERDMSDIVTEAVTAWLDANSL